MMENPVCGLNSAVSADDVFATVSYVSGGRRYGTIIATETDRFIDEFSGMFGGEYDSMVAYINDAAAHGGILSGFNLTDFVSEEPGGELLDEFELFIPAHAHYVLNDDGTVSL